MNHLKSALVLLLGLCSLAGSVFLIAHQTQASTFLVPAVLLHEGVYKETYVDIKSLRQTPKDEEQYIDLDAFKTKLAQLKQNALAGNMDAAYLLGQLYQSGRRNQQDDEEAIKWYQLAAAHGVAYAKNDLAVMYSQGKGVIKNAELAFKLYKEASDAGDDSATYNIGLHYELGEGVPVNYEQAAKNYQKVITNTDKFTNLNCADNDLGALYAKGLGVPQSDEQALHLFKQAASKNLSFPLSKGNKPIDEFTLKNFADLYAKYRLAVEKQTPLSDTKLTMIEMEKVKRVADYYNKECRE